MKYKIRKKKRKEKIFIKARNFASIAFFFFFDKVLPPSKSKACENHVASCRVHKLSSDKINKQGQAYDSQQSHAICLCRQHAPQSYGPSNTITID